MTDTEFVSPYQIRSSTSVGREVEYTQPFSVQAEELSGDEAWTAWEDLRSHGAALTAIRDE